MEPFASGPPSVVAARNGAVAEPQAAPVDVTEIGLPRRTRQASLAPELRDPQSAEAGTDDRTTGGPSPDETRDAFTALQRGWERGRADSAPAWLGTDAGPSETGQQPAAFDEGHDGGAAWPGGPEQEGTA
jgi:hypothetical protein